MEALTSNPIFGIALCILGFVLGNIIRQKTGWNWLNPLLLAIAIVVGILLIADIPLADFKKGGDIVHAFLGPVTVILAVPLYRQRQVLRRYKYPILAGVGVGSVVAIASVILIARVLEVSPELERSLIPHSVTTPIGIGLSESLDGVTGITVLSIIITGILGAVSAPLIIKLFGLKHPIAKGIAIGTASHAIGTSKALELGETEGAMSGLAMSLAAIVTIFLVMGLQTFYHLI